MAELSKELMIAAKVERVIRSCKTPDHIKVAEVFMNAGLREMGFDILFCDDWIFDLGCDLRGLFKAMKRIIEAEAARYA